MVPDTILTLLDPQSGISFDFAQYEIPGEISLGGEQKLVTHELIGGIRQIDAMGGVQAPIEWAGIFDGYSGAERARYLDGLRAAGRMLRLTWYWYDFNVLMREFKCRFQNWHRIPYTIVFEVVADNTLPIRSVADPGIDAALASDMIDSNSLGLAIGDSQISSLLSTIDNAIQTVSTAATATTAMISNITTPILAVQSRVGLLMASSANTVNNVGTLGGVTAGGNPLINATSASSNMSALLNLNGLMGRMLKNAGNIL